MYIKKCVLGVLTLVLFLAMAGNCAAAGVYGTVQQMPVQKESPGQGYEDAGPAISQDEAGQIARELFPELLAGRDLDFELREDYWEGVKIWRIGFRERPGYSGGGQEEHLNININAQTGALKGMYYNGPFTGLEQGTVPITEEAARQKAEAFAKKTCPAEFARTRLMTRDYLYQPSGTLMNQYGFYWARLENGIPVLEDGIGVGVDAYSGRLVNFSVNWRQDALFPRAGTLPRGWESKIMQEPGLYLSYQITDQAKSGPAGLPEATLVYQLNSSGALKIDPADGMAITVDGDTLPLDQYRRFSNLPEPVAGSAGAEVAGPGADAGPAQKISQAEALRAAQEFFKKIDLAGEVVQSGGGGTSDGVFNDEFWNYSLKEGDWWRMGYQGRQQDVGINVYTGEICNYNNYESGKPGTDAGGQPEIDREAALEKALAFIRLVDPAKLGQVVEERQDQVYLKYSGFHNFRFARLVNGIVFPGDGITVGVSGGGEIVNYNCNWHRVRFPSAEDVMGKEEAEKLFLGNNRLKFAYSFPLEEQEPRPGKKPVLILTFDAYQEWVVDARTGEPVVLNQMMALPKKDSHKIPAEHWAAAPLSLLAGSGLLPADGFEPDGPVSRREALRVLMGTSGRLYDLDRQDTFDEAGFIDLNPNDPDYGLIQNAVRRGVLEKGGDFHPEQPVQREELAVWLVRALGFGEVAGMPVKIELKTADAGLVSDRARNYAAIACGLGLFQGDEGGLLRPSDKATWAELAAIVTRAAPRLRNVPY